MDWNTVFYIDEFWTKVPCHEGVFNPGLKTRVI